MTAVGIACCAMWLAVVVAGVLCMRREMLGGDDYE